MHALNVTRNALVYGIVVTGLLGGALHAQQDKQSAHQQLDPGELAQTLSGLEMSELLDALAEKEDPQIMAESLISKANQPDLDLSQRSKYLEDAAGIYKEILKSMPQSQEPRALLEKYKIRLRIANILGVLRCEPYALRLLYLQGGPEDRRLLREMTKEPTRQFAMLEQDIMWSLDDWGQDLVKLAVIVPKARDFLKKVKYKAGWLYLYRALSLPDNKERAQIGRAAVSKVADFARGGKESGVKYWSLLISGIASRLANDHDQAQQYLARAADPNAEKPVRIQAMFEIVRNLIDSKKFEQALQEINQFRQTGLEILENQSGAEVQIDAKAALLENYLYEQWFHAVKNEQQKTEYTRKAQEALYHFVEKYTDPDIQQAFLEIIANKYRTREDYENLNSVVLLAKASRARAQNKNDEAHKLLEMILARQNQISQMVRPLALWRIAMIYIDRRQNLLAGKKFIELAEMYPNNRMATLSAKNAAITFKKIIEDRRDNNKSVAKNIRENYIKALILLVKKADEEKLAELKIWNFDLGWEYQKKAQNATGDKKTELFKKAIEAYSKVPRDRDEYMEARFRSLELKFHILEQGQMSPRQLAEEAKELAGNLESYAADAAAAARQTSDQELGGILRRWGARADFLAAATYYDMLNRKIIAKQLLAKLPKKWPDTPAVRRGAEFEIRKFVEEGQTDQAISKLEEFRKKFPAQAEQLIKLVIQEVRKEIRDLVRSSSDAEELSSYRKAYLKFAEDLYQRAQDASPQRRYAMKQMYAEALLENDNAQKALDLFKECRDYENQQNQQRIKSIEKRHDEQMKKLESAKGAAQLRQIGEKFLKSLKEYGLDVGDVNAEDVQYAVGKLPNVTDESARSDLVNILRKKLRDAYDKQAEYLKNNLPQDATNLRGLAKAHQKLGNYQDALKYYSKLTAGINPAKFKDLYWSAEAGYARCLLEAHRDNKKNIRRLLVRIRQLREMSDELGEQPMGGYSSRFREIEEQAKNILEK